MSGTRRTKLSTAFFIVVICLSQPSRSVAYQTVQGDILRGEAALVRGLGWFELYNANARSINVDTDRKIYENNRKMLNDIKEDREEVLKRQKQRVNNSQRTALKTMEETARRLRTEPKPAELSNGTALNALLGDLMNPAITTSDWRIAKVDLPPDLTIRSLTFKFTPKPGTREGYELTKGLIALSRLDQEGKWPKFLQIDGIERERKLYDAAYRNVRDKCVLEKLGPEDALALKNALANLKTRAGRAVPEELGFRDQARLYLEEIEKSMIMFHASTFKYAEEIIRDTHAHKATAVGELVFFMEKYQLKFHHAGSNPGENELYKRLYVSFQSQKQKLGITEPDR